MGLVAVLAACAGAAPTATVNRDDVCIPAATELAAGQRLRDQGFAGRALPVVEAADRDCSSPASRWALASLLADLGLTAQASEALRRYADGGGEPDRAAALAAALARQPRADRGPTPAERREARGHYARAADARVAGRMDEAIAAFERAYALWPHPLALVQLGLAHKQAGRPIEAHVAYARALATAEVVAGTAARPALMPQRLEPAAVALHPSGSTTAVLSTNGEVSLWSRATGKALRAMAHPGATHLAFSPSGALLATAGDGAVRVWDVETSTALRSISIDGGPTHVAFGARDERLVVARAGHVESFDSDSGQRLHAFAVDHDRPIAALGADSVIIGAGSDVVVYDLATRARRHVVPSVGDGLRAIARAGDAPLFAVGDSVGNVAVIDGRSGHIVARHRDHRGPVEALAFRAGATHLVSLDRTALLYVLALGGGDSYTTRLTGEVPMALSPDATRALSSRHGDPAIVDLWDLAAGRAVRAFAATGGALTAIALGADAAGAHFVAAATAFGPIHLWNLRTGRFSLLTGHEGAATCLGFSSDGALLASGGVDGSVRVWEMRTANQLAELDGTGAVSAVGFSADGRVVGGRFPAGAEAWEVMREMSVDPTQVSFVPARTRAEAAGLIASPSTSGAVALSRGAEPAFAELFATRSGEWVVLARDGRVDGTPAAQALVYWIVGDVQLPGFVGWQRQATDRLLRLLVQRPGQVGLEGEGTEQDDRDAAEL